MGIRIFLIIDEFYIIFDSLKDLWENDMNKGNIISKINTIRFFYSYIILHE